MEKAPAAWRPCPANKKHRSGSDGRLRLQCRRPWFTYRIWEDPLEKKMATHSSILFWRIPWTEDPGGPQFMDSQSQTDWTTNTRLFFFFFNQLWGFKCILTQQTKTFWNRLSLFHLVWLFFFFFLTYNIVNQLYFNVKKRSKCESPSSTASMSPFAGLCPVF